MPASAVITWIGENEKALGVAAGALGTAAVVLWSKLSTLRIPKSWVAEDAKQREAAASPVVATAPHPSAETELQAMRARVMSTEVVLLETQEAIARMRSAMDRNARAAAKEEGDLSAALIQERAEGEKLRAENAQLRAEVAQLKRKGEELLTQLRQEWSGE